MTGLASADFTASRAVERYDGLTALVLWRLSDPTWKPSFIDLMDDVRTCIHSTADASVLLAALREAVKADSGLAPRARLVALEAQRVIAARTDTPIERAEVSLAQRLMDSARNGMSPRP